MRCQDRRNKRRKPAIIWNTPAVTNKKPSRKIHFEPLAWALQALETSIRNNFAFKYGETPTKASRNSIVTSLHQQRDKKNYRMDPYATKPTRFQGPQNENQPGCWMAEKGSRQGSLGTALNSLQRSNLRMLLKNNPLEITSSTLSPNWVLRLWGQISSFLIRIQDQDLNTMCNEKHRNYPRPRQQYRNPLLNEYRL